MSPDQLFSLASILVVPQWLLLAVAPRWRWTQRLARAAIFPLALSALYLVLIVLHFRDGQGSFNSLDGVAALFQNRYALLAGWIHYLAFDLLVGSWETLQAVRRGIPQWLLVPCLLLTFMLGPIGFLAFFALRTRYPDPGAAREATGG
jgi:hypothetical protein